MVPLRLNVELGGGSSFSVVLVAPFSCRSWPYLFGFVRVATDPMSKTL